MATDVVMQPERIAGAVDSRRVETDPLWNAVWRTLETVASLKLTVFLFVLAIILVFIGTLAQVEMDISIVLHDYFRSLYVVVPVRYLFPVSFFPEFAPKIPLVLSLPGGREIPFAFPFPGGYSIGWAMALNLIAAHAIRFRIQARGGRLLAGFAVMAVGLALFLVVVASGFSYSGILENALIPWPILWRAFVATLVLTCTGMAFACFQLGREQHWERIFLIAATIVVGAVTLWLVLKGDSARLNDSGMRILWQLIKGQAVATVLLAACYLLFKKRAGIVLLHGGIGLVMISELIVSLYAVEGQMQIYEGETVNFVVDNRTVELAVVDRADAKDDKVVSVPKPLLTVEGARISDPQLPFDVEVVDFYENSDVVDASALEPNLATQGYGLKRVAKETRMVGGAEAGNRKNIPSAYLRLVDKQSKRDLGVYLFSLWLKDAPLEINGKTYEVGLRYPRTYKPYSLTLLDAREDHYVGTRTPKNYSSDIYLLDPSRDVDREKVPIWMNNPLRFAGETFYQSGMDVDPDTGIQYTVLSVVTNFSWMIPYVGCMIVGTGMFFQFMNTLMRFLNRLDRRDTATDEAPVVAKQTKKAQRRDAELAIAAKADARVRKTGLWVATCTVLLAATYVTYSMTKPVKPFEQMNLAEFGKIPVAHQGRVKPLDTLARNTLRILSRSVEFTDDQNVTQPAIRWLADLIARPEAALQHKVFRIDFPELVDSLGLERRKSHKYALTEFQGKLDMLEKEAEAARQVQRENPLELSAYQRRVLELEEKIGEVITLKQAFTPTVIRPDSLREDAMLAMQRDEFLENTMAPLVVPPAEENERWTAFSTATFTLAKRELLRAHGGQEAANSPLANVKVHPAVDELNQIFAAYTKGDAATFNREVAKYRSELAAAPPPDFDARIVNFESYFNRAEPFYFAAILYVFAFVLAILGWVYKPEILERSAFWLLLFTFGFHTLAIVARIYISGRPPVTNLYTTAVFIGWACVGLALVFEALTKIGVANAVAGVAGFLTLLIAQFLSLDGDTIGVLQAVLDTQFWLATHVVTINLGYATSFVAGLMGATFILRGVFTPQLTADMAKKIDDMTYGALCFAILFSFVGTVLGGLWGDDSWGRFWGWDPKENGALIIVLWNALVLHARWGKMVGDRGMAVLAVLGNIFVSWSWFGVNQLGVGLHSYGFTDGVLMWLGIAIVTHLTIAAIGLIPTDRWVSSRETGDEPIVATLV